jgi:hypothetical protein
VIDDRKLQLIELCDEGVEEACNDLWLEFDSETPEAKGAPQTFL